MRLSFSLFLALLFEDRLVIVPSLIISSSIALALAIAASSFLSLTFLAV
jgi:hypothetical protein